MIGICLFAFVGIIGIYAFHVHRLHRRLARNEAKILRLEDKKKELHSRLKRREKRLDVLFSSVSEAIFRVDQQGLVLAANAQAQGVFRPDEELALPQPMLLFYRDPDWQQTFTKALQTRTKATALPDIHVNGQVLAARLASLGKKQALLLCVDITRQARLERQRQTFLANMMHDLKTPLTSMLGYARSIQSFVGRPELQQESAEIIANEAKHVSSLLDSLLALDRIESSNLSGEVRHSSLSSACTHVCDAMDFQRKKKQITMHTDLPDEAPALAMDFDDLCRVLMNVLLNAIQHSPAGAVIDLVAEYGSGFCNVRVSDEGPGIPEKYLDRVMERFYRVEKDRSRNGDGGHGLGLAIVREFLAAVGGRISLKNRDPHGLLVSIRIPLSPNEPLIKSGQTS